MTDAIRAIQKQIVANLEDGKDISELSRQLATERAKIVAQAEVEGLRKVADERQALKERAKNVIATVARQATAVDEFLAHRAKILPQLQELIEPLRELARMGKASWERDPGECYIYNDQGMFQGAVRDIPQELLPDDFKCPTLEMTIPSERSLGKATEAQYYFEACVGILSCFCKGFMVPFKASTDESLLLGNEPETGTCVICSHAEATEINKCLREGKSLRDIEAKFHVSRSSLSRHKNRCLNPGAIRVERESPAASSNQTFFGK